MTDKQIIDGLERTLRAYGSIDIGFNEGGSGMGYHFSSNADGWPWCLAGTLRESLVQLIKYHDQLPGKKP
jgi:hypothetical protein